MLLRRRCDAPPLPGTFAELERRTEHAAHVGLGTRSSTVTYNLIKLLAGCGKEYSVSHYASNDGTCLPEARSKNMPLRRRHAISRTFPHFKPPLQQVLQY
ncbi:hypothetical protein IG631_03831 [Alternaria alternata]|nr:hypothetical protein IG631_03831 [Alternaria alternata]